MKEAEKGGGFDGEVGYDAGRRSRIAKDYENLAGTLAAIVTLACIRIAARRLARGTFIQDMEESIL